MHYEELFAVVFIFSIFAGVFIVFLGSRQRGQQLEMHHRERMAMIERGQIPLADPEATAPFRRAAPARRHEHSRSASSSSGWAWR
jgi:hypothetical protein